MTLSFSKSFNFFLSVILQLSWLFQIELLNNWIFQIFFSGMFEIRSFKIFEWEI